MSWVKVDDSFCDHPKVLAAGPLAVALWLEGLCYAQRHLTDGVLRRSVVKRMRLVSRPLAVANRLLTANLWERTGPDGRDFLIHDFHEFYLPALEIRARRREDVARKRRIVPPAQKVAATPARQAANPPNPPNPRAIAKLVAPLVPAGRITPEGEAALRDQMKWECAAHGLPYDGASISHALDLLGARWRRMQTALREAR